MGVSILFNRIQVCEWRHNDLHRGTIGSVQVKDWCPISHEMNCKMIRISNRRFVWNFFRLENEHLNNCGKFRAVRDISIAPIDSSDQSLILRMMDEEDGVINRYNSKEHRPKGRKNKDPERKSLLPIRSSLQDLTIDVTDAKRL